MGTKMPNNANETATADASGGAENRLGASLIRPLIAAFDKGGLALVLLIVAAICIMIGGIGYIRNSSGITVPLAALSLGFLILCAFVFVFLTNVYLPARKVIREIRANEELMNAVQDSSLQLADFVAQVTT